MTLIRLLFPVLFVVQLWGCGNAIDSPVSEDLDRYLDGEKSAFWEFFSPFASLTDIQEESLRRARHRLRIAAAFNHYEAWTNAGFSKWCSAELNDGNHYQLRVANGTTYRQLMELVREYAAATTSIDDAFPDLCFMALGDSHLNNLDLLVVPPRFQLPNDDDPRVVITPPAIAVTNLGTEAVSKVEVRWELIIAGRDYSVAREAVEEKIAGGLLPGDIFKFKRPGWTLIHDQEAAEILNRLGPVEFKIWGCIQSVNGRSGGPTSLGSYLRSIDGPDAGYDCLRVVEELSIKLLALEAIVPEVNEMLSDPRFASTKT